MKMDIDVESKINEIIIEGGRRVKMEVDHSQSANEKIPVAKDLAAKGNVTEALEILLTLEKQTRTGCDMQSSSRVLVAIVNILFEAGDMELLNEYVIMLTKKRSQLKAAVTKMVQECYGYVKDSKIPDRGTELKFIGTLRTVTEGKIYVEVERARLTHRLAQMQEEEKDVQAAATTMQELQVETYGSMERKEKVEFILEQMRLCLLVKDYIRAQIISKKISIRFFENKDQQDLKLKYYEYMIQLDQHEGTYLNICRHYMALYNTPCIQEDNSKKLSALKHVAIYVILNPYDNEQSDLLHRVLKDKVLLEIPKYKSLLEQFTNMELISQAKLCELYEAELKSDATDVFDSTEPGTKRWNDMKSRVVEHNIRIMAKYYTRIHLSRMANLLNLSENEAEDFLSTMVVNKTVEARTDRLNGIVDFTAHQNPNDLLNEWSSNISELMSLVMKTTHLINKEEMVHKYMSVKDTE